MLEIYLSILLISVQLLPKPGLDEVQSLSEENSVGVQLVSGLDVSRVLGEGGAHCGVLSALVDGPQVLHKIV